MSLMKTIIHLIRKVLGFYRIYNLEKELLCAQKFNNTISDSKWLLYKSLSPGGYAVDYTFFFSLYRTLDSIKPHNILEFGLGQSSKLIHQYANYYHANAVTIEHDQKWASFFINNTEEYYKTNIKFLDIEPTTYKGNPTEKYKNSENEFTGQKFDLIVIDGPIRLDMEVARIDVIGLLDDNLSDDFVIMIDDYNSQSIKNTMNEVMAILKKKNISFVYGVYTGQKSHFLLTTPKNKFLTTL